MKINIAKIDYKHWTINFINISGVDFADQKEEPTPTSSSMYFTLEEGQPSATISYSNVYQQLHSKNLQFSYDDQNWEDWTEAKTIYAGEKLYVRGLDDYVLNNTASPWNAFFTISQGYVECHGNIMSLCNNSNIIKSNSFQYLFYGNTYLKTAPDIIADEVEQYGCERMFASCFNMKSIDKIDVKKVGNNGFENMFNNCSSLVNIPSILPATELANHCYRSMFHGCESIVTAPELPATTLADNCYSEMFSSCPSLTQAPSILPATTLADSCYYQMFSNCSKLTQVPVLPATTLASGCYSNMFYGCISLVQAPELPVTKLANACYTAMFRNCKSLTQAPSILPATKLASDCYNSMFYNCSSLVQAPELPATTLQFNCYSNMFRGCSELNYVKAMFITNQRLDTYLQQWLKNVSPTGTFVKNKDATWSNTDAGIPTGWTVQTV